jgi:hypothetical protein
MLPGNGRTVRENIMSKSKGTSMTRAAASRIQSHADRTGANSRFKARAQAAAARNTGSENPPAGATQVAGATQGAGKK